MLGEGGAASLIDPEQPLGHLVRLDLALADARGVDEIARHVLTDLVEVPGVQRIGLALTEGGGRRLRFTASDRFEDDGLDWCHIDAYDDVPLTTAVRTGETLLCRREDLEPRYAEFARRQDEGVAAVATVPLPGPSAPVGGLVLYLDHTWEFTGEQRDLLEATARRTAEALRRVRDPGAQRRDPLDADPDPEVRTVQIRLAGDERSPGVARRFLRAFLAQAEVDDDACERATLCLSELVTNAVVHAGTESELSLRLSERHLTVTVSDHGREGRADPHDAQVDLMRVHGRGLQLVEAMADSWGAERDATGTTVWFVLDVGPA